MRRENKSFLFKVASFVFFMLFLVCLINQQPSYSQLTDWQKLSTTTFPMPSATPTPIISFEFKSPANNIIIDPINILRNASDVNNATLPQTSSATIGFKGSIIPSLVSTGDGVTLASMPSTDSDSEAHMYPATAPPVPELSYTWCQKLPADRRFQLVLNNEAVLDKETGLVWERSPDINTRNWYEGITYAYRKEIGGRKGWRLPTVEELASLIDTDNSDPALPVGHPFINVQSYVADYMSSTTDASNSSRMWYVRLDDGGVDYGNKSSHGFVWCVRGRQGHDGY